MVRIAHLADTHLGYKQYNLDEREKDIYDALEEISNKILEERVDIVVHSGDLFDSPRPTPQAYRAFKNFLKKLDGKAKIFSVLGDHDRPKSRGIAPHILFEDQMHILGVGGCVQQQQLNIDGSEVVIAGLSNLTRSYRVVLVEELKKIANLKLEGKISILLLHEGIDKFLPFEGSFEVYMDELPKNFNYLAMGHLHTRIRASFGKGELAYPGSTEVLRRDEIVSWQKNGKGFYVVDFEHDDVKVRNVNIDGIRPQIEARLNYARFDSELESLVKQVESKEKQPIIHVLVGGKNIDRQNVHQTLTSALTGRVLTFRQEIVEENEQRLPDLKPGSFQVNKVIQDYFKDENTAGLALELWNHLRHKDIDEAKKVAEEYFQKEVPQ
jgi:DNA repair protein SbcD/Mre11